MNKDKQKRVAHEAFILMGMLALLAFMTRLWPILLLVLVGILAGALRLLFLSVKEQERIEPLMLPTPPPRTENEQDLLRLSFSIIQRRITEELLLLYPDVRWVWECPNAMQKIGADEPVAILLNRAGGYRRAQIAIHNLQFVKVVFESAEQSADTAMAAENTSDGVQKPEEDAPQAINYELIAFSWVETHLLSLNELCNEAIAQKQSTFTIPASDLPDRESWQDICRELMRNEFPLAEATDVGIQIKSPQ